METFVRRDTKDQGLAGGPGREKAGGIVEISTLKCAKIQIVSSVIDDRVGVGCQHGNIAH